MYSFGKTTFAKFVWINSGSLFSNVTLVEVEMINVGAFKLEVVNKAGVVISSGSRNKLGWSTFDFISGMNPPVVSGMSPYKLRFVNAAPGTRQIKQGQVSP